MPDILLIDVGYRDPCDERDAEPHYPLDELSPEERAEVREARADRAHHRDLRKARGQ